MHAKTSVTSRWLTWPRLVSTLLWAGIIVIAAQHYERGIKKQWNTNPLLNGRSGKSYDQLEQYMRLNVKLSFWVAIVNHHLHTGHTMQ